MDRPMNSSKDFFMTSASGAAAYGQILQRELQLCLDAALKVQGIDATGVYLADEEGHLHLICARGLSPAFVEHYRFLPAAGEIVRMLLVGGKPAYQSITDFPLDQALVEAEGLRCGAIIPILHEGELLGSFNLASRELRTISTDVRGAMEGIAALIGCAVKGLQSEAARKEGEKRFRAIFETSPVPVGLTDMAGRFLEVNLAFAQLTGYSREELREMSLEDITHPEDWRLERRLLQQTLEQPKADPVTAEKRYIRKDKSVVWVEVTHKLWRDSSGKPGFGIGVVFDITARKQTQEQERKHQEKLRSLTEMISLAEERERRRIAGGLHDNVAQSLALCKMKAEMLRKDLADEHQQSEIKQMISLLEDTLKQTRSLLFQISPPVLYELGLRAALDWLTDEIERHYGVACEIMGVEDEEISLSEDLRGFVFQAVRELLINVGKHAEASVVEIVIKREEDMLEVTVQDDGRGFPQDQPPPGGSQGFGLFHIRERLALLDGSLAIEQRGGGGSRVRLRVRMHTYQ